MLDALIHGENGEIARAGETAGVEHAVEAGEDARITVGGRENAIDEIRAGEVKALFRNFGRTEAEE